MSLRFSKKGMEAGFLVVLIITIASFILIGGVVMRFMSSADDKEAEILCHDSILMRAQSAVNIESWAADAEIKLVPPMCKTIDKKIKGDREEIKRQIAEKMARCWWMFGEGRYEELLHGSDIEVLPAVFGFDNLENQCFNCYNLMISQDKIDGGPIGAQELGEFLYNEKYSKSNTTYLQYIQEQGGPGRVVFAAPKVYPDSAYAISMMPKNKKGDPAWKGALQLAASGGIGLTIAAVEGIAEATSDVPVGGSYSGAPLVGKPIPLIVIGAVLVAAGVQAYLGHAGYQNLMASMYSERDMSSIYVGFLQVGEKRCGSGDIAGE